LEEVIELTFKKPEPKKKRTKYDFDDNFYNYFDNCRYEYFKRKHGKKLIINSDGIISADE
jgi:hypothetical protein